MPSDVTLIKTLITFGNGDSQFVDIPVESNSSTSPSAYELEVSGDFESTAFPNTSLPDGTPFVVNDQFQLNIHSQLGSTLSAHFRCLFIAMGAPAVTLPINQVSTSDASFSFSTLPSTDGFIELYYDNSLAWRFYVSITEP